MDPPARDAVPPARRRWPWRSALGALAFRPREVVALAVLGCLVLTGASIAYVRARAPAPPGATPIAEPVASPDDGERLVVHIAGAVRRPGVYTLAPGSRVVDGVRAAGGAKHGADLDALNLARPLRDGERVLVPVRGASGASGANRAGGGSGAGGATVDLNAATAAQLEALPGIGPVLAQRIVDYRTKHGPFRSVRDLLNVEGIGAKKFSLIEPHVSV